MSRVTPATRALDGAGITYAVLTYAYDADASRLGLQAAEALGVEPGRVLKTLMAAVDGAPVCLLVAANRKIAMKRVAAALGGGRAAMLRAAEAERITGYRVGGISPLGQRRRVPILIDAGSLGDDGGEVHVNGGGRGLQVRLRACDLVTVLGARVVALT